jgi:triacylglycerol lipase
MRQNNYPFIFIHGYFGFGDDELISKVFPYFGSYVSSAKKVGQSLGFECHTPTIGPFDSAWDRACELYTQIVGGTVDYGKVHSEKAGHDRYGKTYEGCYKEWGSLDANGKVRKINLVGHSFGAPTGRILIELLANGSEEEKAGTPAAELSDLFKGGKKNWVHSFTTLAGTHEGTSIASFAKSVHIIDFAAALTADICGALNTTAANKVYNFGYQQYHFKKADGKLDKDKIKKYSSTAYDNCYYEMTVDYSHELMKKCKNNPNTYYFTYHGDRTNHIKYLPGNVTTPKIKMFPLFLVATAPIMGVYCNSKIEPKITPEWHPSDGVVNCMSARGPIDEPCEPFSNLSACRKGVWYQMPVEEKDHLSYMGMGEKKEDYDKFITNIFETIAALPSED